ncbi:hypothetical protein B0F90DRAFT_254907 [Multifurca ochricompacta]|uniref:Uncharacterized protein n=1 Tax=Multifurca ochricompacta TaxID=376703 RepID=A0AAD4QP48_9AGAM|nr:hypothetical protein B0F90DRAFT_254907 [Multifurca ochricompacta]
MRPMRCTVCEALLQSLIQTLLVASCMLLSRRVSVHGPLHLSFWAPISHGHNSGKGGGRVERVPGVWLGSDPDVIEGVKSGYPTANSIIFTQAAQGENVALSYLLSSSPHKGGKEEERGGGGGRSAFVVPVSL